MATYSAELESSLVALINNAKTVLNLCNTSRANFEAVLSEGKHWRNYPDDVIILFETINALERAAFWVIEKSDVIRKKNDACAAVADDTPSTVTPTDSTMDCCSSRVTV